MKKVIIIFLVLAAYGVQGQSIGGGFISASGGGADGVITGVSFTGSAGDPTRNYTVTRSVGADITGSINVMDGDANSTNEGSLTVTAGTDSTAIINSNTAGSSPVTLTVRGGLSVDEVGNNIILEASSAAADGAAIETNTTPTGGKAGDMALHTNLGQFYINDGAAYNTQGFPDGNFAKTASLTTNADLTPNLSTGLRYTWSINGNYNLQNPTFGSIGTRGVIAITNTAGTASTITTVGGNYVDENYNTVSTIVIPASATKYLDFRQSTDSGGPVVVLENVTIITSAQILDGTISTVDIADDAVTLAKQATGTANRLMGYDASGNPAEISAGSGVTIIGGVILGEPTLDERVSAAYRDTLNVFTASGRKSIDVATIESLVDRGDMYADSITAITKQHYFAAKSIEPNVNNEIAWNLDSMQVMTTTLSGNVTLLNPENAKAGGKYTLIIKQDGTGGRDFAFGDRYFISNTNAFSKSPYATSKVEFVSDGFTLYGEVINFTPTGDFSFLKAYIDSLEMAVMPHLAGNSFAGTYLESITSIGSEVIRYTDATDNVNIFSGTAGSGARPVLEKVAGKYCFGFDGVNDLMQMRFGQFFQLAKLYAGDFSFFLQMYPTDFGADHIVGTRDGTSNQGWNIRKNSSNNFIFEIRNAIGQDAVSATTSAILDINAWNDISVRCRTDSCFIQVNDDAVEAFLFTPRTPPTSTHRPLQLGVAGFSGTSYYAGKLGNLFMFNDYISDDLLTTVKTFDASNINFSPVSSVKNYETFTPDKIAGLNEWYVADTTYLWEDATRTSPTNVEGDSVWIWASKHGDGTLKYLTASTEARVATFNFNQQNGKGAVTFQNTDYFDFNSYSNLSVLEGDKTVFIVYKATDSTATRFIMSGSSTIGLQLTSPHRFSGNDYHYSTVYQNFSAAPYTSFLRGIRSGLAAKTNYNAWNIVEYRKRGRRHYMSCNGADYSEVDSVEVATLLNRVGHSVSSQSFVGQIGEIIIYDQYLDNDKVNLVYQYLADSLTGWAINVAALPVNKKEDEGRVTMYEDDDPERDYNSFPSAIWKDDANEIWMTWTTADNHNNSLDADDAVVFGKFSPNGRLKGSIEPIAYDQVGANQNIHDSHLSLLSDTCLIAYYVSTYQTSAASTSYWRYRYPNGTLSDSVEINPTAISNFRITSPITREGTSWYASGYIRSPKTIYVIKSTNQGISWSVVHTLSGAMLGNGREPEEAYLQKLSNGKWMCAFREDVSDYIYSFQSSNPDDWSAAVVDTLIEGHNKPAFIETDKRIIVLGNRMREVNDFASSYVASYDMGGSFGQIKQVDSWRNNIGWAQMGAAPVDLGGGIIAFIWSAAPSTGQEANISMKKIKLR